MFAPGEKARTSAHPTPPDFFPQRGKWILNEFVCTLSLCTNAIQPIQPPEKISTWDLLLYRQASNFGTQRPRPSSLLHWIARQHCSVSHHIISMTQGTQECECQGACGSFYYPPLWLAADILRCGMVWTTMFMNLSQNHSTKLQAWAWRKTLCQIAS